MPNRNRILYLCFTGLVVCSFVALARQETLERPLRRIAFGSCAVQNEPPPIWESILAVKPDIFLALGDIVYVNSGTESHADRLVAYARVNAMPGSARMRRTLPLLGIWDDGEFGANDGGAGYPMFDLTSSGLNAAHKKWRRFEPNRHRVATMDIGDNFGLIEIDWEHAEPRIALQIRDVEGDITIQRKVSLSFLKLGSVGK